MNASFDIPCGEKNMTTPLTWTQHRSQMNVLSGRQVLASIIRDNQILLLQLGGELK